MSCDWYKYLRCLCSFPSSHPYLHYKNMLRLRLHGMFAVLFFFFMFISQPNFVRVWIILVISYPATCSLCLISISYFVTSSLFSFAKKKKVLAAKKDTKVRIYLLSTTFFLILFNLFSALFFLISFPIIRTMVFHIVAFLIERYIIYIFETIKNILFYPLSKIRHLVL